MAFTFTWGSRAFSNGPVRQQHFTYTALASDTSATITPPSFSDRVDYVLIDGLARTAADTLSGTTATLTVQAAGTGLYTFTISSGNATVGAVYSDGHGNNFVIAATVSSATSVTANSTTPPNGTSGTLTKITGTGDSTLTWSAVTAPTIYGTGIAYGV